MFLRLAEMRDAGGDQRIRQIATGGDAQAAVVEPCALAALGHEHFVVGGIVDEAGDELAPRSRADRDRERSAGREGNWSCRRAGR